MCGRHGGQGYGLIGGYLGRDQCHASKGYGHWQRDCPYHNYPETVLHPFDFTTLPYQPVGTRSPELEALAVDAESLCPAS
ncbi:hypothetical protein D4764_19G0005370 [Takifugu flavidus]|uniref:Uncharacterized protein n=1 Tax=Takifugu flavidus TaxID=433684 RepID=A0A5C6NPX3_9TELE|nr:hypothetical protein D4764_19G0005370 [Takifugu flavidus]